MLDPVISALVANSRTFANECRRCTNPPPKVGETIVHNMTDAKREMASSLHGAVDGCGLKASRAVSYIHKNIHNSWQNTTHENIAPLCFVGLCSSLNLASLSSIVLLPLSTSPCDCECRGLPWTKIVSPPHCSNRDANTWLTNSRPLSEWKIHGVPMYANIRSYKLIATSCALLVFRG